ncbi:hypothetical protein [Pseudogemmobacter sonorensis]|uniref:hypothetical protein n=1 Tax=Pseudogemmobacter sonorensis TaxID=2989681 RepID=UPI003684E44C
MRWMLRAKRWAQNPPSTRRVVFILGVVAACLAFGLVEWLGFWPDWLKVNSARPPRF